MWTRAVQERWLVGLTGCLLLGMGWHEFLVDLNSSLGAWDEAALLASTIIVILAPRRHLLPLVVPILAYIAVGLFNAWWNEGSVWPLRDVVSQMFGALAAACVAPAISRRMMWWVVSLSGVAALYGILSYFCFRAVVGHHGRPPLESSLQRILLYPYYNDAYPVGWRLAGTFFNDNYFGMWCVALAAVGWCLWRHETGSRRAYVGVSTLLLGMASLWTYSRSATLALLVAVGYLAYRISPRLIAILLVAVALSFPLLTVNDIYRYSNLKATEGGRIKSLRLATETVQENVLLGRGPGTRGLADMQYAKTTYELGLLGLFALAWIIVVALKPGFTRTSLNDDRELRDYRYGLTAAILALLAGGCGGDILEIPQIATTLWILCGFLYGAGEVDQLSCAKVPPS